MSESLRPVAPPMSPSKANRLMRLRRRYRAKRFYEGLNRNVAMVWPRILGVKLKVASRGRDGSFPLVSGGLDGLTLHTRTTGGRLIYVQLDARVFWNVAGQPIPRLFHSVEQDHRLA